MLDFCSFGSFLFTSYIGSDENPLITDDMKGQKPTFHYWPISVTIGCGIVGFNCIVKQKNLVFLPLTEYEAFNPSNS